MGRLSVGGQRFGPADLADRGLVADAIGYERGLDPAPLGRVPVRERPTLAVGADLQRQLACNVNPRVSLAGALDEVGERALGTLSFRPGRRPAPRVELACFEFDERGAPVYGTLPRFALRGRGVSDVDPGGDAPRPSPGGPPSLPAPSPATPPGGAVPPAGETPPAPGPAPAPGVPYPTPAWPGPRVVRSFPVSFHFQADIAGGSATSEVRVYGPIERAFRIHHLVIQGLGGVTSGQFVDVLVSPDEDAGDTNPPTGTSIFPLIQGLGIVPAVDQPRGVQVPDGVLELQAPFRTWTAGLGLKVLSAFVAPAISLPDVHVTVVIEEVEEGPPIVEPRPPLPPSELAPGVPAVNRPRRTPDIAAELRGYSGALLSHRGGSVPRYPRLPGR